jgi:hypothetical protein
MITFSTKELFDILWLEHVPGEKTAVWTQDNNPFLSEVQDEFWQKVLDSITHVPKQEINKLH